MTCAYSTEASHLQRDSLQWNCFETNNSVSYVVKLVKLSIYARTSVGVPSMTLTVLKAGIDFLSLGLERLQKEAAAARRESINAPAIPPPPIPPARNAINATVLLEESIPLSGSELSFVSSSSYQLRT